VGVDVAVGVGVDVSVPSVGVSCYRQVESAGAAAGALAVSTCAVRHSPSLRVACAVCTRIAV
jgi:hypothetical protein